MSFLGDIVSSIGGEKAPAPPIKPPSRPASTNPPTPSGLSKLTPTISAGRPVYKGTLNSAATQQLGNLKRKADDISTERPVKLLRTNLLSISDSESQKLSRQNSLDTKSPISPKPKDDISLVTATSSNAVKPPPKPPQKGSYAEIMARAKEAQQSKAPSQIGMITHKSTEKVRTSKLAERKREDQEKAKAPVQGQSSKSQANGKVDPRRRSASPVKKGDSAKPPRGPKPPLHAPAYRGTMGQAPRRARDDPNSKKPSRYDDYLGTDEEDEDDYGGYGGGDGYYSDQSSVDMEAGVDDIDEEERAADRAAREDDARELALENKLKREKLERKQKLAAMAQKRR